MIPTITTLGAFVDNEFTKGYILDEERLRKINEILITRGSQIHNECQPMYKIYKADSFSYTTENLEKILQENNADWEKIERITIFMKYNDDFLLNLDFGDENIKLHIEGKERDIVFLIFSEIKQYIGNEVAVIKPLITKKMKPFIPLFFSLIIVIFLMFSMFNNDTFTTKTSISKDNALGSQDINLKINYLIETQTDPSSAKSLPYLLIGMLFAMFIPVIGVDFLLKPIRYLFPNHIFLIGKEIEKHKKRISLRQNLLWVVIIGTLVGIGAGLFVWFFTK
jgi:hypothetical protein